MSRRTQRVSSLIRETLASLLLTEVNDPVVCNLTVTDVELSPDLQSAKVFYTQGAVREGSEVTSKEIEKGLQRAAPFLRRALGKRLEMRLVPELHFIADTHHDSLLHVMHLLDEVKKTGSEEKRVPS